MKSKSKSRYIAVCVDGELSVHAMSRDGNCATLCGLDGDDPHSSVRQERAELPLKAKIDCTQCVSIILSARQYRNSDFASALRSTANQQERKPEEGSQGGTS